MSDKYIRLDDALAALDAERKLYGGDNVGYLNGVNAALFHAKEAIEALPAYEVVVTPLEWVYHGTVGATWAATAPFGAYIIIDLGGNWDADRFVLRLDQMRLDHFATAYAAKAAAQADYEARIRSALDQDALAAMVREAERRGREAAANIIRQHLHDDGAIDLTPWDTDDLLDLITKEASHGVDQ